MTEGSGHKNEVMPHLPVFWSFRRCPYAMRARLAVQSAGIEVELREILLRDKPNAFLETSPSGTVPCLKLEDRALDESLDIMVWALSANDPDGWLDMPAEGWDLIKANDGPFKAALDHTKYSVRYPDLDVATEREKASVHLHGLNARLSKNGWLFGRRATLADYAILPFVRQFANIDRAWFNEQSWTATRNWLDRYCDSEQFASIMVKFPLWSDGSRPTVFGS